MEGLGKLITRVNYKLLRHKHPHILQFSSQRFTRARARALVLDAWSIYILYLGFCCAADSLIVWRNLIVVIIINKVLELASLELASLELTSLELAII